MTPLIRIGNQTTSQVAARLPFEFAVQHGFDAFEWFSDKGRAGWCEDDMDATERATLRRIATERGLTFSVHAPIAADPMTAAGQTAIRRSIAFAGEVGGDVVNVHFFPQHHARPFVEALLPLLELAQSTGVRISLENTPETPPDCANAVFGVLATLSAVVAQVGMCLDSGHANLHPATRHDYLRYVDLLGDHVPIIHWHAHENWGDRDSHLPLFTGPSAQDDTGIRRLVYRLRQRGFSGSVVMEQWPWPPEILVRTRQRLRGLFDDLA